MFNKFACGRICDVNGYETQKADNQICVGNDFISRLRVWASKFAVGKKLSPMS